MAETPKDKSVQDNSSYVQVMTMMLSMLNSSSNNIALEKEVSYLKGKVDTVEKILIGR